ncbi:MAG: hypothetical protein LBQ02_02195 [Candidatus Nomurabacteria bacterium]|jgi:ATP-dependent Clp protease ATP-binding subunit ClpC|nr:hypothetical protein [Candidatus Nomurabacteria bacterium]
MDLKLDYQNSRAVKARFNRRFGKILKIISLTVALLLTLGGATLLMFGFAVGWLVVSLSAYSIMLYVWQVRDLAKLPPTADSLSNLLDCDLLGLLPADPSPRDIATAVAETDGGQFFQARFGIPLKYLQDSSSDDQAAVPTVWETAWRLHQSLSRPDEPLSAATVVAALIQTQPPLSPILSTLHLDQNDILEGAAWHLNLTRLIAAHHQPKLTGGIARDWSFGYIPTLERYGVNLSTKYAGGRSFNVRLPAHTQLIQNMIDVFSGGGAQNAALVGALGSGKRTIVEMFAEELMDAAAKLPQNLKYRQVISLDATALLGAASGRGELENLVNRVLVEAFHAKNVIICLENAQLFFEDGTGSVDITNILLPVLESGAIRLILTLDEQRFVQITERNPALASTFNRLQVQPPDAAGVMKIVQNQIINIEFHHKVTFRYQALKEVYRLSERYIQDIAQPRSSIQLLEMTAGKVGRGLVTEQAVQGAVEAATGVKVGAVGDVEERQKLLNLENLITSGSETILCWAAYLFIGKVSMAYLGLG